MGREDLILKEVALREQQRAVVKDKVLAIRSELFDRQLALIDDPAKEKAALCTRRAGKTNVWVRAGSITALEQPRSLIRIWGISRSRIEELIWGELKFLCQRHMLGVSFNDTKLSARFPNGSEIRLIGADKQKEAEKKRGDKTAMEVVVESQLFTSYLQGLVEDVVTPGLADLGGTFYLEGTPGPVCAGHWYSVTGGNDTAHRWMSEGREVNGSIVGAGWSCHRWSVLDNPHMPHMREWLANHKAKRRWEDDNPTYVREWLGRWVNDFEALFYAFDPVRNTFRPDVDSVQPWGPGWSHVLGWDLGFHDDMALVVWGYHPARKELFEAFSWKQSEVRDAGVVMAQIDKLVERGFNITTLVADTGGGGKMYVEGVLQRFPYAFQPAKKTEKYEHVRLLNDELRTGFVKLQQGSPYAIEMAELPKDPDWPDPEKPERPPTEDPHFANHCCDAGLYAFRAAAHFLHQDTPPPIARQSREWYKQTEEAMIERMQKKNQSNGTWLENYDQGPTDSWEDNE